jgi:hypothetical protein
MTIEVTGCHDCKLRPTGFCKVSSNDYIDGVCDKTMPPSCPIQTESITIKKKDNEK